MPPDPAEPPVALTSAVRSSHPLQIWAMSVGPSSRRTASDPMQRRSTTTFLRQLNRSAVVDLIRRDGVISPSNIAQRLKISLPTVMRVLGDLIDEGLAEYDGFDEAVRGRPPARVKY